MEAGINRFYELIPRVDFETVEDLEETFEFLLKFPLQMNTFLLPNMTSYRTYQYSEDVIAAESKGILNRPSDQNYDFYHYLYLFSRSTLPISKIREIRDDPKYR